MNDKLFKVVRPNRLNADEDLMGFYASAEQAQEDKKNIVARNNSLVKSEDELIVKPVDPEMIHRPVCTDYMHYVRSLIPDHEWRRVMQSAASAEIFESHLMCGGVTYYYLSRMIPKDWTVIDFGASYAAQSYLFAEHKQYIAVEPFKSYGEGLIAENFIAAGTKRYEITTYSFVEGVLPVLVNAKEIELECTFAICNYVPNWFGEDPIDIVHSHFRNCYTFYP